MIVNPETLREYRESKNLSQAELEKLSGVSKKTISRIERGDVKKPNQTTREKLANALGVDVSDLAKSGGEREKIARGLTKTGYRKLTTWIDSQTTIAYELVHFRYGVSVQTLIEMAPLFFTILAEGSLAWRRRKVNEFHDAVEELNNVSNDAPHLMFADVGYLAEDEIEHEQESIKARDIFGKKTASNAFNPDKNNPFADYLRLLCNDIDNSALRIDPYGDGFCRADNCLPDYQIAPGYFEAITNKDSWAMFAIVSGYVQISEIPKELMNKNQNEKRVAWIISKIPEDARKKEQKLLDEQDKIDFDQIDFTKMEKNNE